MSHNSENYEFLVNAIAKHQSDECLNWPFYINTSGYGIVNMPTGKPNWTRVHRIAFFLTHGRWPEPQGRHTCDNRACFNPRHVIEGTAADNSSDMVKRNRQGPMKRPGEKNPFAKLNDATVRQIRLEHGPLGYGALARKFGVGKTTIGSIVKRRAWTHLA